MFVGGFAAIEVLVLCRSSDRALERKWHMFRAGLAAAAYYLALPPVHESLSGTAMLLAVSAGPVPRARIRVKLRRPKSRKNKRVVQPRDRRTRFGELVQIDSLPPRRRGAAR